VTALLVALAVALFAAGALLAFTASATRLIEARFPPAGKRIEVGGGAIHVLARVAREAERGAVLMIHGASGNALDLDVALGERLSALGFRTLSCDRPGHGHSDRVGGRAVPSPPVQAAALRRAAENLGATQAIVVAHSLGAIVALAMALEAPAFVRALVLIAPLSHPWSTGVAWYNTIGAHPMTGPLFRRLFVLPAGLALLRPAVREVFAPNPPPAGFIAATRLPLLLRPMHFQANCEDVTTANAAVGLLAARYSQICAPTEIVAGDGDGIVSTTHHARALARDIPGARLTILPAIGHSPHHVAPERIAAVVVDAERRALARETTAA
jgi:pimeloyl-ACP methyl ester carboxylesterase